ncbi:MAG: LysR family transcriptional regulator [Proteobacteria bacterium]|nr:LysR family transcriptional regulator [Pseudomonadota bacterium]
MNLRALQYFVKLSDLRHFSKAAEACFVSQPTLSTQVRKLEDELGVQLVERSPRKIMLTPVGEEIAERARLVLSDIDQIRAVARRAGDPADGNLRLGLFPTLAPYLLPHVIPNIRKQYPNLRLQLAEEKTDDILKMLHQGELDAALLALPINDNGLDLEILFDEPFVLAVPGDHPLATKSRIILKDLNGSELLLLEEGHCLREHALEVCALAGAHERVDFHATSMETLRQMVAANVGITLMPLLSVKPPIAQTSNLVTIRFASPTPSRTIAMVWRNSSALADFLRELAACFSNLPPDLLKQ